MRWRLFLLIVSLLLTRCSPLANPTFVQFTVQTVDDTLINYGIQVYRTNYCGSCHTLTVANTSGTFGPNHDFAGTHATEIVNGNAYSGFAKSASDYIRESILQPNVFYTPGYEATNHHMPQFTHLSDTDIDALVYLLSHQR